MLSGGFVDYLGFHLASSGWIFSGWIAISQSDAIAADLTSASATGIFENGTITGPVRLAFFDRSDLDVNQSGVIAYIADPSRISGKLSFLEIEVAGLRYQLAATGTSSQLRDVELLSRLRSIMSLMFAGQRNDIVALLGRRGYSGIDTIEALSEPVRIGIDEAIICQPEGVVLIGWHLSPPGVLASMKLVAGSVAIEISRESVIRIERQDVADTVGAEIGVPDRSCGFMAFVPLVCRSNSVLYLQVETRSGELAYLTVRTRMIRGIPAMMRMLSVFEAHYEAVRPAFDNVIGPALRQLNAERLLNRPHVTVLVFGTMPPSPRCSVIIPLYGRVDFLESQMALISDFVGANDVEFIYVLDDPLLQRETETLAESVWLRFGLPMKLLLLSVNVGFAPANNIGLAYARGEYVCFMNSDVFPTSADWISRLCNDLEANPDIGAIGGLLLFEDGSVQHEGMSFKPVPALGNFSFPLHNRKGWRPRKVTGIERMEMITGACMVMLRQLASQLGGFDEGYIIGDFEDCDLCARIGSKGLRCAVDHDVKLLHLERKSQVSPDKRWRLNLTVYNAWLYDKLWMQKKPEAETLSA